MALGRLGKAALRGRSTGAPTGRRAIPARLLSALVAIVAVLSLVTLAACGSAGTSAEDLAFYKSVSSRERDFIYACQTPEGSLLDVPESGGRASIDSYEASIAIDGILQGSVSQKDLICARHYLEWYGSQMLEGRDLGLPEGVVPNFDVVIEDDYVRAQTPVAPAVWDANIGSYLMALGSYAAAGGASDFVASRYGEAHRALEALLALQGEDGLTRSTDADATCYLVDNLEVLRGLEAAVALYDESWIPGADGDEVERRQERDEVAKAADACRQGILERLWDGDAGVWSVGLDAEGEPIPFEGWEQFYPSAVAQLYPIIFAGDAGDADDADGQGGEADASTSTDASADASSLMRDARAHYDEFCARYAWQDLAESTRYDDHYWPSIAYAAARMDDADRVHTFLEAFAGVDEPTSHTSAHSLAEAGWTARTASYMIQSHEG